MNNPRIKGTLGLQYAIHRNTKTSLKYRLWRRTHEVLSLIERYSKRPVECIIDLGAADGKMLKMIHNHYPESQCVGVEYSDELVTYSKDVFPELEIVQGDIQSINYPENTFDVAVATAVIEHVPNPEKVIHEARRVLRSDGIFILTSPDPFWERIATMVGHLNDDQHNKVMNIEQLSSLLTKGGFDVLEKKKFMISPFGLPFEFGIERCIRRFKLDFMLANQIIIGKT